MPPHATPDAALHPWPKPARPQTGPGALNRTPPFSTEPALDPNRAEPTTPPEYSEGISP